MNLDNPTCPTRKITDLLMHNPQGKLETMQAAADELKKKRKINRWTTRENHGISSDPLQVHLRHTNDWVRRCRGDSRVDGSWTDQGGWTYSDPLLKCHGIPSDPGGNPPWWDDGRVGWRSPEGEKAIEEHERDCPFRKIWEAREMLKLHTEGIRLNLHRIQAEEKKHDPDDLLTANGDLITSESRRLTARNDQFVMNTFDNDSLVYDHNKLLTDTFDNYSDLAKKKRLKQIQKRQKQKKRLLAQAEKKLEKQPRTKSSCVISGGKKRKKRKKKTKKSKKRTKRKKRKKKTKRSKKRTNKK